MIVLRLVVVFFLYLAAELVSPVAATPVEFLDGEAEESLQHAAPRRLARMPAERAGPVATAVVGDEPPAAVRSTPVAGRSRAHPVIRKIPAAAVSDAPSAPQDH